MSEKNEAESPTDASQEKAKIKKPSFLQVVGSVASAFVGIQSSKNKERDFTEGNFKAFVVVGLIFTLIFIASVYTMVQLVVSK